MFSVIVYSLLLLSNANNAKSADVVLTDDGIGIFKIGAAVKQADLKKIKQVIINKVDDGYIYRINCDGRDCLKVSINEGIVATIEVLDKFRTLKNIGCGSSIKEAKKAYGNGRILRFKESYYLKFAKSAIWFKLNEIDVPNEYQIPEQPFDEMINGAIDKASLNKLKQIFKIDSIRITTMELWLDI